MTFHYYDCREGGRFPRQIENVETMTMLSGWVTVLIAVWLLAAIAVDTLMKYKQPGDGKITAFKYLWVAFSLAGLALILTNNVGYAVNGVAISAMCFGIMLSDHLNNKTGSEDKVTQRLQR